MKLEEEKRKKEEEEARVKAEAEAEAKAKLAQEEEQKRQREEEERVRQEELKKQQQEAEELAKAKELANKPREEAPKAHAIAMPPVQNLTLASSPQQAAPSGLPAPRPNIPASVHPQHSVLVRPPILPPPLMPTRGQNINFSEFEAESDPFDSAELKTINEFQELAAVLQTTAAATQATNASQIR